MGAIRKPLQGVWNIIRFNRYFYLLAATAIIIIYTTGCVTGGPYALCANIICLLIILPAVISLGVSFYVYDVSGLYQLHWLDEVPCATHAVIANINAGFDETSALLQQKFRSCILYVFDFYNPLKHTEISIQRARKAYPAYPGTVAINTAHVPLADKCLDSIFLIFAAHEIRDDEERILFFTEITRTLKPDGYIVVTEHLRDAVNFCAYNIGFLHFLSRASWYNTFAGSGLTIVKQKKLNPFVTTFILQAHDNTH